MSVTAADLARTMLARASAQARQEGQLRETIVGALHQAMPSWQQDFRFSQAWLIGSLVSGTFGARSDIDLVVVGLAPEQQALLEGRVEWLTHRRADVLRFETLPAKFQARILAEGVRVA